MQLCSLPLTVILLHELLNLDFVMNFLSTKFPVNFFFEFFAQFTQNFPHPVQPGLFPKINFPILFAKYAKQLSPAEFFLQMHQSSFLLSFSFYNFAPLTWCKCRVVRRSISAWSEKKNGFNLMENNANQDLSHARSPPVYLAPWGSRLHVGRCVQRMEKFDNKHISNV